MKGNAWLAGYVVFTVLLLGGAGFYFFQGRAAYGEKFTGWDDLKSKIARLEKETPFPNEENAQNLEALVTDYDAKVKGLFDSLARYQKPLDAQLKDTDFTNRVLKEKLTAFVQLAGEKKLEIEKKEEFYLGFDAYKATFARTELVPLLNFQLEAVDHVLRHLAESGAERLVEVTREPIPGEVVNPAAPAADASKPATHAAPEVAQKFPMQVRFVSNHQTYVEFVNRIANDKDFFLILRVLKVDNSNPDGPAIGGAAPLDTVIWKNKEGVEATREQQEALGKGTLGEADFFKAMEDAGWTRQRQDARIIFGQEKLEVLAVIDVVRFLPPDQVAVPATSEGEGSAKGKTKSKSSRK